MRNWNGHYQIYRKLYDNPILYGKYRRQALWHLLIALACWQDQSKELLFDGHKITLKRGQLLTGRNELARITGVSPSAIRKTLFIFKKDEMLEIQTSKVTSNNSDSGSLITILKYEDYQCKEQGNEQGSNKGVTREEQGSNKGVTLTNNIKKDNTIKKEKNDNDVQTSSLIPLQEDIKNQFMLRTISNANDIMVSWNYLLDLMDINRSTQDAQMSLHYAQRIFDSTTTPNSLLEPMWQCFKSTYLLKSASIKMIRNHTIKYRDCWITTFYNFLKGQGLITPEGKKGKNDITDMYKNLTIG